MVLQIGYSSTGTGPRYDLGTTDSIFVIPGAYIVSIDDYGISGIGSYHTVTVAGAVFGGFIGVNLGNDPATDTGQYVHVLAGGMVAAYQTADTGGIRVYGSSTIVNDGQISAYNATIFFDGAGGSSSLVNRGIITASNNGVTIVDGTSNTLANFGTIQGDVFAYYAFSGTASDLIRNYGQIIGEISTGDGADTFVSHGGTVEGDIHLGAGNDRYVGTSGGVTGAVYGDAGADTFFGNQNAADVFVGGADVDTLDFRLGGQVTLALDLSFAQNGAALGDTYFEMENVFGSDTGNDVIRGNPAANALFGWGGNDSLDGAGGADVLRGGVGVDTLTGGTGDDTFRFSALNECGDLITDFSGSVGNNDRFQITAAAFGGMMPLGTLAASQFQTRTDNVAQDADDRFIFNTTDRTLWFDADGNGAGAAIMVADLQAGAVVTAADILLI